MQNETTLWGGGGALVFRGAQGRKASHNKGAAGRAHTAVTHRQLQHTPSPFPPFPPRKTHTHAHPPSHYHTFHTLPHTITHSTHSTHLGRLHQTEVNLDLGLVHHVWEQNVHAPAGANAKVSRHERCGMECVPVGAWDTRRKRSRGSAGEQGKGLTPKRNPHQERGSGGRRGEGAGNLHHVRKGEGTRQGAYRIRRRSVRSEESTITRTRTSPATYLSGRGLGGGGRRGK
jgi:hypothetical protein